MTGPPLVSVVICTHDRDACLPKAIESVLTQRETPTWELIVVDNGSTDRTPDVVERYVGAGPVRRVFEPMLGLSRARNTGWRAARGRYVAYLDDDAIASDGWLAAIPLAFEHWPAAGMVGGRVEPIWERPRPPWVSDRLARALTILDWSPTPLVIDDPGAYWLAGANMAIPRDRLVEVGGFCPSLGRRGSNMMSGEETLLQYQLRRRGYPSLYYPAMAVRHLVPEARLRRGWFLRRFFWQGVSETVMAAMEPGPAAAHARSVADRLDSIVRAPARLATALVPTEDPAGFTEQCLAWVALGRLAGRVGRGRAAWPRPEGMLG